MNEEESIQKEQQLVKMIKAMEEARRRSDPEVSDCSQ